MITLACKYCGKIIGSRPCRDDDRAGMTIDRVACFDCTYQAEWYDNEFWPL